MDQATQIDLIYLDRVSLREDLSILWATLPAALGKRKDGPTGPRAWSCAGAAHCVAAGHVAGQRSRFNSQGPCAEPRFQNVDSGE